ncbi:hypothetical protein [Rhizobium leguminosarum]|uniref:hypothetical protein n=1 Tax=Rhizobium leguminosarum TaxID=384 RepID=UPI0035170648
MTEAAEENIRIKYTRSSGYTLAHADGMWGGATAQNDLHIAFFAEVAALPEFVDLHIENKQIAAESNVMPEHKFVRETQVGVIMDFNTALSFLVWLEDKIDGIRTNLGLTKEQVAQVVEQMRGGQHGGV